MRLGFGERAVGVEPCMLMQDVYVYAGMCACDTDGCEHTVRAWFGVSGIAWRSGHDAMLRSHNDCSSLNNATHLPKFERMLVNTQGSL